MKAVILAGGYGTRLSEETHLRPKPMVEIGGMPILLHIMKIYSHHGIDDFVICLGYKGYVIKEYFVNYRLHTCDITFDMKNNKMEVHRSDPNPWRVTLVDTGEHTMSGGRIKRVQAYIGDKTFLMTYGDGVGDIDITASVEFHRQHGKAATISATRQPGRFGALHIQGDSDVAAFQEKPHGDGGWINGGFFVLEPSVFELIDGDDTAWEKEPLERLAKMNELRAFRHEGFWQPMDTLRDKRALESLWESGKAPWKVW